MFFRGWIKKCILCVGFLFLSGSTAFSQYNNFNTVKTNYSGFYHSTTPSDSLEYESKEPILGPLFSIGSTSALVLFGFYFFEDINYVIGMSLMGAGLVLGPSAGNIYAQNFKAVRKGLTYRLGGTAVLTGTVTLTVVGALGGNPLNPLTAAIGLAGYGLFLYGIVYDFITPYKNVKKYNSAQKKQLSISPAYDPVSNSIGISMKVNF